MSEAPNPRVSASGGETPAWTEPRQVVEERLRYLARRRYALDDGTAARLVRSAYAEFLRDHVPSARTADEQRQMIVSLTHRACRAWVDGSGD